MKKPFTLLEIIIVIFLITLITGAIGYNMKGALDKGKVFRTKQAMEQLQDLLLMCVAEGDSLEWVANHPQQALQRHGLAKSPNKIVRDGWNNPFVIGISKDKSSFTIRSEGLRSYERRKGSASSNDDDANSP